jgi:hypothetical protein
VYILNAETVAGAQYSACVVRLKYVFQRYRNMTGAVFNNRIEFVHPAFRRESR